MVSPASDPVCIRADRPERSGAAALAEVVRRYGVDVSAREVVERAGLISGDMDMLGVLLAARHCGLDPLPLEGEFDDLPEVPRPNIVLLREPGGQICYHVLAEIDATSALVGDTLEGRFRRLTREEFVARWSGDAIQLIPNEAALAGLRRDLVMMRSPWRRLGLSPISARKVLFAALALVVAVGFFALRGCSVAEVVIEAALGLAALLSLWLTFFGAGCVNCNGASRLVGGLPLAPAGLALYASLFVVSLTWPSWSAEILPLVLAGAAGAHAALVIRLLRSPFHCVPCLGTAAVVFIALVAAVWMHPAAPVGLGAMFTLSLAVMLQTANVARRFLELELGAGTIRVAEETLAESPAGIHGRVRIVAYTRSSCPVCNYYELVVRGLLQEEFGDAIEIEERCPARGQRFSLPLYVVRGSADFLVAGLRTDELHERLRSVINAALAPRLRDLDACGALVHVRSHS